MFFGSFWHAFSYLNPTSNLDELFKKENLTLEDILDEENILNEVKSSSQKFSDYMKNNPDKLEQMINYVIKEPDPNNGDEKKCYKYPFYSSEIFQAQPAGLSNFLFDLSNDQDSNKNESYQQDEDDDQQGNNNSDQNNENANKNDQVDKDQEKSSSEEVKQENNVDQENKQTTEGEEQVQEQKKEQQDNENKEQPQQQEEQNTTDQKQSSPKQDATETLSQNESQDSGKKQVIEDKVVKQKKNGKDLLLILFSFLEQEGPLNPTSAGYFFKAVQMLITKNGYLFDFFMEYPIIISNLIKHIENKSISDIISRILTQEAVDKKEQKYHEKRIFIINQLFEKYKSSEEYDEQDNIINVFIEVLTTIQSSEKNPQKSFDSLADIIHSKENIQILVDKIKTQKNLSIFTAATMLNQSVTFFNSRNTKQDTSYDEEQVKICDEENQTIELIITYMKDFIETLFSVNQTDKIPTSYGQDVTPLGVGRLKVIELISNLAKFKNETIYKTFQETQFFTNLLIFEQAQLLQFIVNNYENKEFYDNCNWKNPVKRGYISYLTRFANKIIAIQNKTALQYMENNANWKKFVDEKLAKINEVESKLLGGQDPRNNNPDPEDTGTIDLDIQKIYQRFHNYFNSGGNSNQAQSGQDANGQNDDQDDNNENNQKKDDNNLIPLDQDNEGQQENQSNPSASGIIVDEVDKELSEYNPYSFWKLGSAYKLESILEEMEEQ